jgi:hypothetical protein
VGDQPAAFVHFIAEKPWALPVRLIMRIFSRRLKVERLARYATRFGYLGNLLHHPESPRMCPAIRDGPRRQQVNKPKSDVEFTEILEFGLLNPILSTNRPQIAWLACCLWLSKY